MGLHQASVIWERAEGAKFVDNRYSRAHRWEFDGGAVVPASSSPAVVPLPLSDAAGVDPSGASWYMSIGQGMGEALRVASERGGSTLTDRATYLSLMETLLLDILVAGDRGLTNEYSVITTTRGRNCDGADALAAWLRSEDGQALIGAFGAERFGRALFEPLLRRP